MVSRTMMISKVDPNPLQNPRSNPAPSSALAGHYGFILYRIALDAVAEGVGFEPTVP